MKPTMSMRQVASRPDSERFLAKLDIPNLAASVYIEADVIGMFPLECSYGLNSGPEFKITPMRFPKRTYAPQQKHL